MDKASETDMVVCFVLLLLFLIPGPTWLLTFSRLIHTPSTSHINSNFQEEENMALARLWSLILSVLSWTELMNSECFLWMNHSMASDILASAPVLCSTLLRMTIKTSLGNPRQTWPMSWQILAHPHSNACSSYCSLESVSTQNDQGTLWETSKDVETHCFVHEETFSGYG